MDTVIRPPSTLLSHPVIALGFRPFFLLAALLGTLWIPLWLLEMGGHIRLPLRYTGMAWHGHEMVFGFTVAVIAGFLLTAVRNWTSQPTPTGANLLALATLWWLGRLGLLFGELLPVGVPAVLDLAFLPALAAALAIPLWRGKNWRNFGLVGLLALLFAANLAFHLGGAGLISLALRLSIYTIVLIIVVVGGRVIPMFTRNAIPGVQIRQSRARDWLAFGSVAAVLLMELAPGAVQVGAWVAFAAAGFNAWRLSGWGSIHTWRKPILWVLHMGYAWLPLGFFLKGLAAYVPSIPPNAPLHALTVGTIGVLCLGMMSRVGLGHTGRPLVTGPGMSVAFGLLGVAAVCRAILPIFAPGWYLLILLTAGLCWSVAFLLMLVVYWPILTQPRIDGRPG